MLASSTGSGGFGGGLLGSVGGAPLTPGRRNQYDVGVQQTRVARHSDRRRVLLEVHRRRVRLRPHPQHAAGVSGAVPRVETGRRARAHHACPSTAAGSCTRRCRTRARGCSGRNSAGSGSARTTRRSRGRITTSRSSRTRTSNIDRRGTLGFWGGLTWRYDSGLVAVAVPTYAAALRLTGDEQAAMGLYCGDTFATRDQPLRSCASPTFRRDAASTSRRRARRTTTRTRRASCRIICSTSPSDWTR